VSYEMCSGTESMRKRTTIWHVSGVLFFAQSLVVAETSGTQEHVQLWEKQSESCPGIGQRVVGTTLLQRSKLTLLKETDVQGPDAQALTSPAERPHVLATAKLLQRPAGLDVHLTQKPDAKAVKLEALEVQPPRAQVHAPSAEHPPVPPAGGLRRPANLGVQVDAEEVKPGAPDAWRTHAQGDLPPAERPPVLAASKQHPTGADAQQTSQVDGGHGRTVSVVLQPQMGEERRRRPALSIDPGPLLAAVVVLMLVGLVLWAKQGYQEEQQQLIRSTTHSRPRTTREALAALGRDDGEPGRAGVLQSAPAVSGPERSSTAVKADGPCLCPELVVPEGDERTLLVPLATPGGSSETVIICDLHGVPVCKAAFSTAKPSGRRMILTSATGDAVLAFCGHAGVDQGIGTGLAIFDRSGRAFGTLRADGPRPADGYSVVLACGCWQLRFRGNPPNRDLNVTDDRGSWLAGTEAHGAARYSVRVGPHVDAGLMILAVLGIDLLLLTGSEDVVQ